MGCIEIYFKIFGRKFPPIKFLLQPAQSAAEPQQAERIAENVMTVAKDSRYARYLKMVQVVSPNFHLILDC